MLLYNCLFVKFTEISFSYFYAVFIGKRSTVVVSDLENEQNSKQDLLPPRTSTSCGETSHLACAGLEERNSSPHLFLHRKQPALVTSEANRLDHPLLGNWKSVDDGRGKSFFFLVAALKSFLTRVMKQNVSMRACPAPRYPLEENDCSLPTCLEDKDCSSKIQSCCFNGCIFTCIDRISPPPVIDWEVEPRPPVIRQEGDAVLRCSTSPRPAPSEPLNCPKGYVCRIDDGLNELEDMTNIGVCVPEAPNDLDPEIEDESGIKEKTIKQTDEQNDEGHFSRSQTYIPRHVLIYLPGGCVLSETQYKHMQDFKKRSYVVDCFCNDGNIECQISSKNE